MRIKFYQRVLLFVLSIALMQISFAAQEKPIKDNGTAQAYVSIKGLTRIAVLNDRIEDVRGPDGAYQIKADLNQGAVFIQPTPDFQKKPFTLFIATEQNHNYVLRLQPRDQNADTILLNPPDAQNPVAAHWETATPYTQIITQLMTDMVNQSLPEGYAVDDITKAKNQQVSPSINIKLINIYQGAYLQGLIYSVTNRTAQTITVSEPQFYQSGDRAIALSQHVIAPHSQIFLYKVRSRHE